MIPILEWMFIKRELAISTVSENMAFNKQNDFEQEIWLKVVPFIEVVTSDKRNKEELIFSKTES